MHPSPDVMILYSSSTHLHHRNERTVKIVNLAFTNLALWHEALNYPLIAFVFPRRTPPGHGVPTTPPLTHPAWRTLHTSRGSAMEPTKPSESVVV